MVFDGMYYENITKGFEPETLDALIGVSLKWEAMELANTIAIYNEFYLDKMIDEGDSISPRTISAMN